MTGRAQALAVSVAIVLLIGAAAVVAALVHLTGQAPAELLKSAYREGVVLLYEYAPFGELSDADVVRLYQGSCTRKCHGRDVIESKPRTAAEWESVMARMRAPDRADLGERVTALITRHLQTHFLSNVPTVLPPQTMRFVRQHLWRSDFGESDLFVDIIYVPREHYRLLRYLGVRQAPPDARTAIFVVFLNTHRGAVPAWNLAELSTMRADAGRVRRASAWEVLYGDAQQHHRQGLLSFPEIDIGQSVELEVTMELVGLGSRTFQWRLPVPPLPE